MKDQELFDLCWKPVVGYEGFYEVSSDGQVRSLGGRRGSSARILKWASIKGYHCVSLCINGRRKTRLVHRLVAEAFIGISNMPEVNHIDGDKGNNRHDNLEWVSHNANISHAVVNKLLDNAGERHGMHKLSEADVRYIRQPSDESTLHLSQRFDVSEQTIKDIRNRKSWRHLEQEAV